MGEFIQRPEINNPEQPKSESEHSQKPDGPTLKARAKNAVASLALLLGGTSIELTTAKEALAQNKSATRPRVVKPATEERPTVFVKDDKGRVVVPSRPIDRYNPTQSNQEPKNDTAGAEKKAGSAVDGAEQAVKHTLFPKFQGNRVNPQGANKRFFELQQGLNKSVGAETKQEQKTSPAKPSGNTNGTEGKSAGNKGDRPVPTELPDSRTMGAKPIDKAGEGERNVAASGLLIVPQTAVKAPPGAEEREAAFNANSIAHGVKPANTQTGSRTNTTGQGAERAAIPQSEGKEKVSKVGSLTVNIIGITPAGLASSAEIIQALKDIGVEPEDGRPVSVKAGNSKLDKDALGLTFRFGGIVEEPRQQTVDQVIQGAVNQDLKEIFSAVLRKIPGSNRFPRTRDAVSGSLVTVREEFQAIRIPLSAIVFRSGFHKRTEQGDEYIKIKGNYGPLSTDGLVMTYILKIRIDGNGRETYELVASGSNTHGSTPKLGDGKQYQGRDGFMNMLRVRAIADAIRDQGFSRTANGVRQIYNRDNN